MSSILDALRELENTRGRRPTQVVTPVETPGRVDRAFDAAMPILGGAVVGAVVLGLAIWAVSTSIGGAPRPAGVSPAAPVEATTPARPPTWLDTAEAPRARVDGGVAAERPARVASADPRPAPAPAAPRPVESRREARQPDPAPAPPRAAEVPRPAERPAVAPAPTPVAEGLEEPAPVVTAPQRAESRPGPRAANGPLVVEMIHYSPMASERTVTLRVNGRRLTLHQRESAEGIEVQLIQPDGVYVQRGSDVFLATIDR